MFINIKDQTMEQQKKLKNESARVVVKAEPGTPIELPEHVVNEGEPVQRPTFSTLQSKESEGSQRNRGPNITPRQEMRVPRNANHHTWSQCFKALCAKWDRAAHLNKGKSK